MEAHSVRTIRLIAFMLVLGAAACKTTASGPPSPPPHPPPPAGGIPDPSQLPVAASQAPDNTGYAALNLPSRAAGYSYNDPTTNVRIWKVTSATVPESNTSAGHDYSDGGNEVSLGWGPDGNTHTILIRGDGMPYYLVDFTSGVGFSNYRMIPANAQPDLDLCFTFSNISPRIAYIITSSTLIRFNTETMAIENTGAFPQAGVTLWLQNDRTDKWFVGLVNGSTAFAWNSQTDQFLTHSESWLDEARLERDGRYVVLADGGGTVRLWDLSDNSFGAQQDEGVNFWFAHNANLRSQWVTQDANGSFPFGEDRYSVSGTQVVKTNILDNSLGNLGHHSGNWVQSDVFLNGDLNKQWSFTTGYGDDDAQFIWRQAIGMQRSDGSDARLLLHHYSSNNPEYFAIPWGKPSPDGKVVIFNSDMRGSGRYDLFVAEMPLKAP